MAEERLPLSEEGRTLRKALEDGHQDPFHTLQGFAKTQQPDPEMVRVTLVAAMMRLMRMPGRARRKDFISSRDPPIARSLLEHMWSDVERWLPLLLGDLRALEALCYFAVAEGLDKHMLDWVTVEDSFNIKSVGPTGWVWQSRSWRATVLRCLCRAYGLHAESHDLNQALQAFFTVRDREIPGQNRKDYFRVDLSPALFGLTSLLCTGSYYRTDRCLFEEFTSTASDVLRNKHIPRRFGDALNSARLPLYHPTSPDISSATELLSTKGDELAQMATGPLAQYALTDFLVRIAVVATANGQAKPVADVKQTYLGLFGVDMPAPERDQRIVGLSWKKSHKGDQPSQSRDLTFKRLEL
ncbi:hypothetical protein CLAFUW4_12637 [Fulvia fulva]|uniref:Uncharacterized protein n=1 Tax=Passalora fulva TaxID=5499 RepID=A0A9Q8PE06_PASFU|nr:uncharacterized protein CLAFUR5_11660 [Fulvia fulva]KAK4617527.1 hypothetical protein CLAFUR4_12642 [Fulvia fulva]KAK4618900.1 hypothetical protein CLAFUR0_12653 [Fulvia fulva]UJO20677.1 hypothetical protein CLAFUR5_11660 [Fulvia fulva]WPV18012.1 hypothetical protein CLAFUW4_12637 [Fulvia fulva]WPV32957.1 hypothetical protein CLAFUW7_12644 [Fulvia fulva]